MNGPTVSVTMLYAGAGGVECNMVWGMCMHLLLPFKHNSMQVVGWRLIIFYRTVVLHLPHPLRVMRCRRIKIYEWLGFN